MCVIWVIFGLILGYALAMLWPATAFATLARLDLGGVLAILPRQEAGAVRMELLTRAQPIRMLLPAVQL